MDFLDKQNHLIENGKIIPFGVYDDLIADVRTEHFDAETLGLNRRTERKAWVFYGFYSKEITCGFAIVDAGMVATAFSYIFIPEASIFEEDKVTVPFGFDGSFDPNLYDVWKLKNYSIHSVDNKMLYQTQNKKFSLTINVINSKNGFSVVAPSDANRPFHFTYKNLLLDSEVTINYKDKIYKAKGSFGSIDFSKGYPPRETKWNWLSFIGKTESGFDVAANVVKDFNENLENVLYVDGKKVRLSKANFLYRKPLEENVWQINTLDNLMHLDIQPQGKRSENINLLLMKSQFTQVFGEIEGDVRVNGNLEKFKAVGVAEEHFARW